VILPNHAPSPLNSQKVNWSKSLDRRQAEIVVLIEKAISTTVDAFYVGVFATFLARTPIGGPRKTPNG
jgi:hypothetical protein